MKRLKEKEIDQLLENMEIASRRQNPGWESWHSKAVKIDAILEFPTGEIMNKSIRGFVWIWYMKKNYKIVDIEKGDHFDAQGLEMKIRVDTNLITALLACRNLPRYRRGILIEKGRKRGHPGDNFKDLGAKQGRGSKNSS